MQQDTLEAVGWSDAMALGLAPMDKSHRKFIEEVAELAQSSDEEFIARFPAFVVLAEHDFNKEEAWMEEIDFPGIRPHLEEHAMVLSALHHAAPHVAGGDLGDGREIIKLMPQWFLHHLATQDRSLALALQMASIPV